MTIYRKITTQSATKAKQLAVLLDPDKVDEEGAVQFASLVNRYHADYVFVGGSHMTSGFMGTSLKILKESVDVPVIIFPGNAMQVNSRADAILLLSLISGRNPELLIGNHVSAAQTLKNSGLEIISTGYMLIESGKLTSVLYMSNTMPIPSDKNDIAVSTAMAGEMLGLKLIYMDAGSGAQYPVPVAMIMQVKESLTIPLIVGGGIRTANDAQKAWQAGADIVVVGNALEKNPDFISDFTAMRNELNRVRVDFSGV